MPARRKLKHSPLSGAIGAALERPKTTAKTRTSLMVAPEVGERIRDAAYWSRRTLVDLVEEAILEKVEALEDKRGETFPPRPR